jgi:hypothetical protein
MAALDPIKRAKGVISSNIIGGIIGGVAGVMLVRKYMPTKGWLVMTVGALGGVLGGAFAQSKLKAYSGSKTSADETKK